MVGGLPTGGAPHEGFQLSAATSSPATAAGGCAAGEGSGAPCGTWAWGAAANLTAGLEFEGSYNASEFLTGGSLTAQGAYIDLEAALSVEWADYSILNVSSPTPGQLYATYQAGDLTDVDLSAVAQGTFPAPGDYGADSNVTLQDMNASVVIHEKLVDRYQAFLNLSTDANGSLALENEHLQFFRTLTVSLSAVNFPNVTTDPSGGSDVAYETGAIQASVEVEANVVGNFTPALLLVKAPVSLGESWTSSSEAAFSGEVLWSITASGVAPNGQPFTYNNSGQDSANANVALELTFSVVGERTVYFPNGASETDYVIQCQGGPGSPSVELYDGLLVVPGSVSTQTGGAGAEVAAHPAAQEVSSTVSTPSRPLYSPAHKMTDASDATPVSGQTVTGAPMSAAQAQHLLDQLGGLSPLTVQAVSDADLEVGVGAAVLVVSLVVVREVRRRRRAANW